MIPKCSLNGYNSPMKILGLLFMAFILVVVVIFYLRTSHNNITEKYIDSSGEVDQKTIEYKSPADPGNRSTFPRDKYPGANYELIGGRTSQGALSSNAGESDPSNVASSTEKKTPRTTDIYKLRDCKVYFTDDTVSCDAQGNNKDNSTKTCGYTFDGWSEFDTYTDNNGNVIKYPKKIYKPDASNTKELINAHFTSKCFKEFDNNGRGGSQRFEYKENKIIKYDSKGTKDNTEIDTNIFGGKKYTSIQFMNSENPGDNLSNVIDSICSVKYNKIHVLNGKTFYKFILGGGNREIKSIHKLSLKDDQTEFDSVPVVAIKDFAILGSHGLRFNNKNRLQIFINKTAITAEMNIFKFTYVSNLCKNSQIKKYTMNTVNLAITDFLEFGTVAEGALTETEITNIDTRLITNKRSYKGMDGGEYIDYKKAILDDLEGQRQSEVSALNNASESRKNGYRANINSIEGRLTDAYNRKENFTVPNNAFLNVLQLERTERRYNSRYRIFDYASGYINNRLGDSIAIPEGAEVIFINDTDICLVFKNKNNQETQQYNFTVPDGESYECDILLAAGGGSGGTWHGGGGGGGDVKQRKNVTFGPGTHRINVGRGGQHQWWSIGQNGFNSSIILSNGTTYTVVGGGGGGSWWQVPPSVPVVNSAWGASSGGGGGANEIFSWSNTNWRGASGNNISGNGGSSWIYYYWRGGGGGGGGGRSSGGNGGEGTIMRGGNGGKGTAIDFFGTGEVNYGQGGGGGMVYAYHNWNSTTSEGDVDGSGSGGSSWHSYIPASDGADTRGGGGGGGGYDGHYRGGRGGTGVAIIRIKKKIRMRAISTAMSGFYNASPVSTISMPPLCIQYNVLTSFVYLQKGFYRFRAELGNRSKPNANIIYAELVVYDESNLKGSEYKCKKVFKYNEYNGRYKPSYLRQYIQIPTNKFYKIAYTYHYYNNKPWHVNEYFNLFYKYLTTAPESLEGSVPSDLIAWYRFDGSIDDINPSTSKKKFHLVETRNRVPNYPDDTFNDLSYLNTNYGAVKSRENIDLAKKSFSIAVWMRTKNNDHCYFICQGKQYYPEHRYYGNGYLHVGSRGSGQYVLGFWGNDLEYHSSGGRHYPEDANQWVHMVFVVDVALNKQSCGRRMYRNGTLISEDKGRALYEGEGKLYIGQLPVWGEQHYNYNMDISDFMLFEKALTGKEAQDLFKNVASPSEAKLDSTYVSLSSANNDSYFSPNFLRNINTSMDSYLFNGEKMNAGYNSATIKDLFSSITYNNNNYKSFQSLASYIDTDNIDYFGIRILKNEKNVQQSLIDGEGARLSGEIKHSNRIRNLNKLTRDIKGIDYKGLLPIGDPILIEGMSFASIFGTGNEKDYITYDKVQNFNNLTNPGLTEAVYVEALN
jgi:hypothetical protein